MKDDFEDVTTCTECAELNIPISCKPNLTSLMQIITIEHYDFHLTFSMSQNCENYVEIVRLL